MAFLALLIFSVILGVLALVDLVSKELDRRHSDPGRQASQSAHKPSGSGPAAPDAEALRRASHQGDCW